MQAQDKYFPFNAWRGHPDLAFLTSFTRITVSSGFTSVYNSNSNPLLFSRGFYEISKQLSLLQVEPPIYSAFPCREGGPVFLWTLWSSGFAPTIHALMPETPELEAALQVDLRSAEWRGRISSLTMLAMLLLMQAPGFHWLMLRSFSAGLLSITTPAKL